MRLIFGGLETTNVEIFKIGTRYSYKLKNKLSNLASGSAIVQDRFL